MNPQTVINLIIVFFTAASFVLSFSAFYRQFLLRHDRIACSLDAHGVRGSEVTMQFSLSNFGTHAVKLRAAYLSTKLPPTMGEHPFIPTIDDPPPIPATVIRPGDIHTIQIKWNSDPLKSICRTEEYKSLSEAWVYVRFIFVTINGQEIISQNKLFIVQSPNGNLRYGFPSSKSWIASRPPFSFLDPKRADKCQIVI